MRSKRLFIVGAAAFFLQACTVGFGNASRHVPSEFSRLYIPAAKDHSPYGGNASRLSQAVRERLARRSDLILTDLHHARWALSITVLDRVQTVQSIDDCNNPGTPTVANGAYECSKIHPELTGGDESLPHSFVQPSLSPDDESMSLVVLVKAIDLNTGKLLWSKRYEDSNIPAVVFNEIGDTGDGRVLTYMQNLPDMHALRYQESVDNAVSNYSQAIAKDIENLVLENW